MGITPAPAGKTLSLVYVCIIHQDHPRTCGENSMDDCTILSKSGSPPHLRGKHIHKLRHYAASRITPAPAGKTQDENIRCHLARDHPRTCGENYPTSCHCQIKRGSPPHLRGKPLQLFPCFCCSWITPAPAGKTLKNDVDTL